MKLRAMVILGVALFAASIGLSTANMASTLSSYYEESIKKTCAMMGLSAHPCIDMVKENDKDRRVSH